MEIPFHKIDITEEDISAVAETMRGGWLTMGPKTFEFERTFASFLECDDAVAVSSCTAALHLALAAEDIGPGDEVIIPVTTFVATSEAVLYTGAKPVFADVLTSDHTIDPEHVKQLITPKTRAIIAVHYSGNPARMEELLQVAREHSLILIEDAAHAFPASYNGRTLGTIGDYGCFSFYATKTITTGEGGMIVSPYTEKLERIRSLRLHGISKSAWNRYAKGGKARYDVYENGYKYNMTDTAAALGLSQLKRCGSSLQKRRKIAEHYESFFSKSSLLIPYEICSENMSAHHLYPLRLNIELLDLDIDIFADKLMERGIATSLHFIPFYEFTYYQTSLKKEDYPGAQWIYERCISLPIYPAMNSEQISYTADAVMDICNKYKKTMPGRLTNEK
ncbi:MAG: DegT/DnrJ/EryC1/StrS family aminotransferase [Spirochaetes bacterium]|jgi:dTDP-4-amino-4,6-dideoxygalactose transaminase|nr:DegT/DnrJ/EryC1/StrS family aminotransferase [Spirochaetota bacterium]